MPRRKSLREKRPGIEKRKNPYRKKDNMVIKVAAYLLQKGNDGATIYNIISAGAKIGLSTQDQTRFTKKIMEPMEKDGWISKRKYSARNQVYVITDKGGSAVSDALQLHKNESLLNTLEAFQDIIR